MGFSPLVDQLLDALRVLPGVGPRTAQRMALHLLERDRMGADRLVGVLGEALERVGYCARCRTLTEEEICQLCLSPRRDERVLCVVESPADQLAIEGAGGYVGRYFVLHGHLSPLDGIGPEDIGLDALETRVRESQIEELVLATNPTVEGEATAHYIAEQLRDVAHGGQPLKLTRLAYGVPMGGELEYVDGGTLSRAFSGRLPFTLGEI
ncbi:recombination protein RecR [Cobetia marina]|jgi:recombination protein RecR|uniref:Recombination protein RecR n=1 Tax=Cobetia marina TaxID=28258 RepID=A0ABU9GIL8_COBMA|nr:MULTISPECIES: recombination mediator RecR [Cobetia]AOM00529.1 recombination protein RecR [Cobetia marina]AZV30614.1 recombination protein RecR [Cobetia sp. ICG0124]MDA5564674.1 recombination mediator RecR [Cobetia sp. MMG027]MDH2291222.1 recombination mediator RecR [Cobetia sp. 10Alg 146]MDH2372846.1 recombination mediator RecR [Cobetia sp. 3AK]